MALEHFDKYTAALEHTLPPPLKQDPFAVHFIGPGQDAQSIIETYFSDVQETLMQASRYELYATKCAQGCFGYVAAYFDKNGDMAGCYSQPMWCFEE